MLQNILKYWTLNENLIVNDFDRPYIVIVFASSHLLMDTASDSLLRSISILSHHVLSLVNVFTFYLESFEKNKQWVC